MLERPLHDEARSDLRGRAAGDLRAAEAETAEPAEGRLVAELLLEVEADSALRRPTGPREERLDAVDAGAQPEEIIRRESDSSRPTSSAS